MFDFRLGLTACRVASVPASGMSAPSSGRNKAIRALPWRNGFWHLAAMNLPDEHRPADSQARWRFLRDVVVFQLKMLLDNVRDFALMPISLVAAALDLLFKSDREGALFYRVLHW